VSKTIGSLKLMDPQEQFCRNQACRAYGRKGEGHVVIHSRREQRYQCKRCRRTVAETAGTALYRLRTARDEVVLVVTLLAYGCPVQAIVAAFGLDERTVARWQARAGAQCRRVHEHLIQAGRVDLGQVQADELRVRAVGGVLWLASAIAVPSRLWLGGVVSATRDGRLIRTLLERVRASGAMQAVLLCTDGLLSYPTQALRLFRVPARTGRRGHPRMLLPAGLLVAQAIKRYTQRRVASVERRVVQGTAAAVTAALIRTQGNPTAVINTAYIERLNATFRARLAALTRRTRAGVHQHDTLEAGMWLVGTTYNFCRPHRSLRRPLQADDSPARRWIGRTPAQAADLTDHRWSVPELLLFPVPGVGIKRRGPRPKWLRDAARAAGHAA
jgi:transposase-like protein